LVENGKELPKPKKIKEKTTVGIDVGLKTFATLSDGQKFENPKYLHQQLQRLKKEQRTLARRYKRGVKISDQSKGYHKQRLVVAKLHEKISNQRADFLQKTSTAIIKQYDTICLEDLNIAGMIKNKNLAKAISDVSWSEFNRMLEYKAEWYGKNIRYIGRFDPSSKICSVCGTINKELKLSDREWNCEKCSTPHDRDENAAKNIKIFGLRTKPSTVNVSR
jgi:putative transposase